MTEKIQGVTIKFRNLKTGYVFEANFYGKPVAAVDEIEDLSIIYVGITPPKDLPENISFQKLNLG